MFEEVVISFKVKLEIFERKNESVKNEKIKALNICTEGRIFEIILMHRRKSHDAAATQYRSSQYIQSKITYLEKTEHFFILEEEFTFIRSVERNISSSSEKRLDTLSKVLRERYYVARYLVENGTRTTLRYKISCTKRITNDIPRRDISSANAKRSSLYDPLISLKCENEVRVNFKNKFEQIK